jgi:hypothetical protein
MTANPTEPMPADPPAVNMARALFEALGRRDVDAVLALDAADAVGDVVAVGEFRGKPAIRRFLNEVFAAFPDYELVVDRVFGDDSSAVVLCMRLERSRGVRSRESNLSASLSRFGGLTWSMRSTV